LEIAALISALSGIGKRSGPPPRATSSRYALTMAVQAYRDFIKVNLFGWDQTDAVQLRSAKLASVDPGYD